MSEDIKELISICSGKHIYIQTHNFPDPDAIASSYGLQRLFEHYGIESTICYEGRVDRLSTKKMIEIFNISMHEYENIIDEMTEEDYIVCVDSQKNGGNILDFVGNEIACIDHHPTYEQVQYMYSDIRMVGSCATIIADYFKSNNIPIDSVTASALMYGMRMDTLQFSRGVTLKDIQMFEYLFEHANHDIITVLERNTMEYNDLRAYGAAISNIEMYDKVGFASIPFDCPDPLIATVADFILNLDEVEVAIIYSIRTYGIKFSVRSEDKTVDAGELIHSALAGIGNGGGHTSMAGGFINAEDVKKLGNYPDDRIRELFIKELKK